jgi:hypothetical protein
MLRDPIEREIGNIGRTSSPCERAGSGCGFAAPRAGCSRQPGGAAAT